VGRHPFEANRLRKALQKTVNAAEGMIGSS
jgi:hypothetical protein